MELYTKNGRPLQVSGDIVYTKSGIAFGRIRGNIVYGTDGSYVGTIVNERLVYRSSNSSTVNSPFVASNRSGSMKANRPSAAIWGDEPQTPD